MIRKATLNDIDQLAQLFNSYRVFYDKPTDIEAAEAFILKRMQQDDSQIFVYDKKGKLLGFTQLYPLFSSTRMQRLWLLNDLFVDENQRGQGISKKLIDRAKELVRETDACGFFLQTEKTNTIGNQLYPSCGLQLNTDSNFYEWFVS